LAELPVTVGVVYRVPGQGAVLACDSRITGDNAQILSDQDEKWLVAGSSVACCAGSLGGLWNDLRAQPPRSWPELRRAITDIDAVLSHDRDYEVLAYDRRADSLWHADHSGEALRKGLFATIGCGGTLALGVLEASAAPRTLEAAEKLVRRAVRVACKYNSACGGRTRVLLVQGKRTAISIR
jgi:20S proteasome alpha/beta subunit